MQSLSTVKWLFAISVLTNLIGCQTSPKNSSPGTPPSDALETIAILGTNDLHGALAPIPLKTREPHHINYSAGGIAHLASYIQILRSEFGNKLIWLDSGNQFQGTIESELHFGAPMVDFFNLMGLTAASLGHHDFDFGTEILRQRMKQAHYPYLSANPIHQPSGAAVSLPNIRSSLLVNAGRVKVGVIGLYVTDTPKITQFEDQENFQLEKLKMTTLEEAEQLRAQGADVIVVALNGGLKCDRGRASPTHTLRNISSPQGDCGEHDLVVRFLHSLPAGTVDTIVAGHIHQLVHHWVSGVPVIQAGADGRYINVVYLTYDLVQRKIIADQTRIEGPIPICPLVFDNQNDCNGDRPVPKNGRGPLVTPSFHGQTVNAHPPTQAMLESILAKADVEKSKNLGTTVRTITHASMEESALGNLVADAMRQETGVDLALINPGGMRAPLEAGPITYEALFRALPFENTIALLHLNGDELRLLLRIAESGSRGFASISGAKLRLIDVNSPAPSTDLKEDGKFELWEINRLIEIRLESGRLIEPKRMYTVATTDFIAQGGDDFGWIIDQIPKDRIVLTGSRVRTAVIQYIQKIGTLNSPANPLLDHKHPRLKFEKKPSSRPHNIHRKKKKH